MDDALRVPDLYLSDTDYLHRIPTSIVSDRNSKFLSHFLRCLWKMVGTKLLFGTSHHPQIDGQAEVTNRTLSSLLRSLVSKTQKDWDIKLAYEEFSYNRSHSSTTSRSPFEVVYKVNPFLPIEPVFIPKSDIHVDLSRGWRLLTRLVSK